MATTGSKFPPNPPLQTEKSQICLRLVLIPITSAAAWLMLTNTEKTLVYGLPFEARYDYSSAFKFFAWANVLTCAFAVFSLLFCLTFRRRGLKLSHYFFLFLHDLSMVCLELSACAAATAIGFVGKYGIEHAGWQPICGEVGKFCNRVIASLVPGCFSVLLWLALVIVSASKSSQNRA